MVPVWAVIVPALAVLGWSVTVRRATWGVSWERPNTLCVAFQAAALVLCAPTESRFLGRWLYDAVGVTHLDDYLGHLCYVGAASCIVYAAAARVTDDRHLVTLTLWAVMPGIVAVHVMLVGLIYSRALERYPNDDFFEVPCDGPLVAYWIAYAGAMVWILGCAIRLLLILCRDPRSRHIARLFIGGCVCGIAAGVIRVYTSFTPDPDDGDIEIWVLACSAGILCALAAGCSWRAKMRPFKTQRPRRSAE